MIRAGKEKASDYSLTTSRLNPDIFRAATITVFAQSRSVKVNRRDFEGNDDQFATGENGQARAMKVKR